MYFRGAANLAAVVQRLKNDHGLVDATDVVLTGGSAGGLATILNLDRVQRLIGPTARVVGLANAGFFKPVANHTAQYPFDPSANYTAQIQHLAGMQNVTGALAPACVGAFSPDQQWRCMLAPDAEPHVRGPLFVLQSKFDHFQLNAELGLRCMNPGTGGQPYAPPWVPPSGPQGANCTATDLAAIAAYGTDFWWYFQSVTTRPAEARGVFLTSCIIHGQTTPAAWNFTVVDGTTPAQAFAQWFDGDVASKARDGKWVENCTMPCNSNKLACAPWH